MCVVFSVFVRGVSYETLHIAHKVQPNLLQNVSIPAASGSDPRRVCYSMQFSYGITYILTYILTQVSLRER